MITEILTGSVCFRCGEYHPYMFNVGEDFLLCSPCQEIAGSYWWEFGLEYHLRDHALKEVMLLLWFELEQLPMPLI